MDLGIKKAKRTGKSAITGAHYRCINCGTGLDSPMGSVYARRFCSDRCKNGYIGNPQALA